MNTKLLMSQRLCGSPKQPPRTVAVVCASETHPERKGPYFTDHNSIEHPHEKSIAYLKDFSHNSYYAEHV